MSATGYSGKPLAVKLGIRPGETVLVIDPPSHVDTLVSPLPEGARLTVDDVGPAFTVWLFVRDRAALEAVAAAAPSRLAPGGQLWVSWPKKTSSMFRDLTEDGVRSALLPTGLVDVKVCAVDADWSGLKLVRRRA